MKFIGVIHDEVTGTLYIDEFGFLFVPAEGSEKDTISVNIRVLLSQSRILFKREEGVFKIVLPSKEFHFKMEDLNSFIDCYTELNRHKDDVLRSFKKQVKPIRANKAPEKSLHYVYKIRF
eukprot:TRINITY_DN1443_c0_g1_i2.p1 TRINITY_DN1443_c0_g1~~TRINITY_DN1443_c0_g1_i2.p1  ORF type:complete len:120 (-),score=0.77 TRINITY_DN1443_c0_g1_i2:31-390(-)